jgi:penicillin-binding protein 2
VLDQWVVDEGGPRPAEAPPGPIITADAPPEAAPPEDVPAQGVQPAGAATSAEPPDDNGEDQ